MKRIGLYILLGFTLSVLLYAFERLTNHLPMYQQDLKDVSVGSVYKIDVKFKKAGCYEIGLASDERVFGLAYQFNGEYNLKIFDAQHRLLDDKNITKERGTQYYSDTTYSELLLDVIDTPFKKHRNVTVELTIIKPEKIFSESDNDFYFYVDYTKDHICGKRYDEYMEAYRIKNLIIDTQETNKTLKPLYKALMGKNLETVKQIIDSGISVNVKMIGDGTPLHFSSYVNDALTSKYLIKQGADIEALDIHQRTPMYYALENNATDAVRLLMEHNATLPELVGFTGKNVRLNNNGAPPFFYAVCSEMFEMADLLSTHKDVDIHQMYNRNSDNVYAYLPLCVNQVARNETQRELREAKVKKLEQYLENRYGMTYKSKPNTGIKFDKEKR
jgi:hypothetical protein